MKSMFFAIFLVCTVAWTLALDDMVVNPQKMLANHPGVKNLQQWLKEHELAPEEIAADSANLRGVKVAESTASPRFLYSGVFLSSNDCTGPMSIMYAYRFNLCQPRKGGSSSKLVYGGIQDGQHVASMESFTNSECDGAPVFTSPMGGFSASCDSFMQSRVVDELPGLEAFVKNGFRSTIANEKKACKREIKHATDVPDENIREMFYNVANTCMNMGDKDSMFMGCTIGEDGSSFMVREYDSEDTSCSGPFTLVTVPSSDLCKRKRDTIFGTGTGYMNWSCNV